MAPRPLNPAEKQLQLCPVAMEINGVEAPRCGVYSLSLYLSSPLLKYMYILPPSIPLRSPPPPFINVLYPSLLSFHHFSYPSLHLHPSFLPLSIDRTLKMYIGGAQKRPDAPYARPVMNPSGKIVGQVSEGNRKDIREAVEAAHRAAPGYVTDWLCCSGLPNCKFPCCALTRTLHHLTAGGSGQLTIVLRLSTILLRT